MGFSGSKISGHSGRSFKHRKAFAKQKKYYKNKIRIKGSELNSKFSFEGGSHGRLCKEAEVQLSFLKESYSLTQAEVENFR